MKIRHCSFASIVQLLMLLMVSPSAHAQGDTIMSYNALTGLKQIITPLAYDTTIMAAQSGSSIGLLPGVIDFTQLSNYCPYDTADPRCLIEDNYSLENYPLRCVVRIKSYKNGEWVDGCSGIIVGRDFVLTAGHCVLDVEDSTFPNDWPDSIVVVPAFDTTTTYPELGHLISRQFYLLNGFASNYIDSEDYEVEDIALLKLDNSAGLKTGWTGMGFSGDSSFYANNIFYCSGYPGECDFFLPYLCYDFGSMYYQHIFFFPGDVSYNNNDAFINSPLITYNPGVVKGYSGSGILNNNGDTLTCYGVAITPDYVSRINRPLYFAFKDIMDADSSVPTKYNYTDFNFNTFPNPTTGSFYLNCTVPANTTITATMYNILGQSMGTWLLNVLQGYSTQQLDAGALPEGVYALLVTGSPNILSTTRVVIQR